MYLVRPAIKFAEVYKKEQVVISGLDMYTTVCKVSALATMMMCQ